MKRKIIGLLMALATMGGLAAIPSAAMASPYCTVSTYIINGSPVSYGAIAHCSQNMARIQVAAELYYTSGPYAGNQADGVTHTCYNTDRCSVGTNFYVYPGYSLQARGQVIWYVG